MQLRHLNERTQAMLMSEVDQEFVVDSDDGGYRVVVESGDHLILVAGATYGKPAANFQHPNIVARKCEVHEFKHYRKAGSKFWTARPGVSFYLVIPKDRIEMIPERGFSYVPVKINGQRLVLNVSGGGSFGHPGWTDWVHRVVHTSVGFTKKTLKLLADVALSPGDCKAKGISFPLVGVDDSEKQRFIRLAAEKDAKPTIKAGSKIVVDTHACSWDSEVSPVVTVDCPGNGTHLSPWQDPAGWDVLHETDDTLQQWYPPLTTMGISGGSSSLWSIGWKPPRPTASLSPIPMRSIISARS